MRPPGGWLRERGPGWEASVELTGGECDLEHGQEVDRQLLVPGGDPAALLQPADQPLHHVAPPVLLAVERRLRPLTQPGPLVVRPRDHRPDLAPAQPAAD